MENAYHPPLPAPRTNGQATTSLVTAIIGWVTAIVILCLNMSIAFLTIATYGIGSLLYICTGIAGCLSPLMWLIAIITGHVAKGQIRSRGEGGNGQATAGLVMGYIGLGLGLLSLCILGILLAAGGISLSQLDPNGYW
jgi:hypothetical protein